MADKQITEHKKQVGLTICACKTSTLNTQIKNSIVLQSPCSVEMNQQFFFPSLISQDCFNENQTNVALMKKQSCSERPQILQSKKVVVGSRRSPTAWVIVHAEIRAYINTVVMGLSLWTCWVWLQWKQPARLWSRTTVSAVRQVGRASLASRRLQKGRGQNSTTSSGKLFYISCLVTVVNKGLSVFKCHRASQNTFFVFSSSRQTVWWWALHLFYWDNIQPITSTRQNLPAPIPLILHAHSRATVRDQDNERDLMPLPLTAGSLSPWFHSASGNSHPKVSAQLQPEPWIYKTPIPTF